MPAYTCNEQSISAQAFYAIACHPQRHVAVQACAGAGKTWILVGRMVRALLAGAQPQQILAITFTKKAAAEVHSRLHEDLRAFASQPLHALEQALQARGMQPAEARAQAPALQGLYERVLRNARGVQVRTFHGWFAALLRTAPLHMLQDMGLPLDYSLLDNDSTAIEALWQPFFAALLRDAHALADFDALVAAHGRSNTLAALRAGLAKRTEFLLAHAQGVPQRSVPTAGEVFAQFSAFAHPAEVLCNPTPELSLMQEAAQVLTRSTNKHLLAGGLKLQQALASQDCEGVYAALWTQKDAPRVFAKTFEGQESVRAAQQCAHTILQACAQHDAHIYQQRMTRLLRLLCEQYAQLKRSQGWVDMADVERAACTLLRDSAASAWMQQRLDAQLQHVLIDEFQDTNPMQWQALLAWLSGYTGADQAPSFFLVGDPKQSIYRFRRAESQVFTAAQAFVRQGLGGDVLSCEHTHRCSTAVTHAVNATMLGAQAQGRYEGFRLHTTQSAQTGCVGALPQVLRAADESCSSAELECRQAAQWLCTRLADGLAPQDVLVLARTNAQLLHMQRALAALGVHAEKAERGTLGQAPEVQDIVALVDALSSGQHHLSLARALKSPLFGADDAQLADMALGAAASQTHWLDWLLAQAHTAPNAWSHIAQTLARWQRLLRELPPHDALCVIYREGDVLARYAAYSPPAQRASALARLRQLPLHALLLHNGRYSSAYAWVRALRQGTQEAMPQTHSSNAVKLLTIHGAKGLQADLVLLLGTDPAPTKPKRMDVLVDWPGACAHPRAFVCLVSEKTPPPSAQALQHFESAQAQREEHNALYVAMTRARRELILSSSLPKNSNPQSWWKQIHDACQPQPLPVPQAPCALPQASEPPRLRTLGAPLAAAPSPAAPQPDADAQLQSALGQAMHQALQWMGNAALPQQDAQTCSAALARQFGLTPQQASLSLQRAQAIVQGQGAWAWSAQAIDWAADEVDIAWAGRILRIDRLVHRRCNADAPAAWWVLDFKSSAHPQHDPALRAQLQNYRQAVQALHPKDQVHAAWLCSDGTQQPCP